MEQRLGAALSRAAGERRRFVQETLDTASEECTRLYARIHPDEPIGAMRIAMDPNQRASLLQTVEFGDASGLLPQVYFSDSHLDSLGLCVFLAITNQFSGRGADPSERPIVVLDDVFASLDQAHRRRVGQLLAEEARKFAQVIVATHASEWRDVLAANAGTQVIELGEWSL
jgi:hypothetical protein